MAHQQSQAIINGVQCRTPWYQNPPKYAPIGAKPNRLIVACVWWGTLYGKEYVENLYNSVKRNLDMPFEFVCITNRDDVPEGVRKIKTPSTDAGWWQKINLFRPNMFPSDARVLYLDLDVVIINDLMPIACSEGELVMIENFGGNAKHSAFNSSCMVWTPNERTARIHKLFNPFVMRELHGDQCWIWRVFQNDICAFRRDLIDSYRYGLYPQWCRRSNDTAVLVFHGRPKPHEVQEENIRKHWR